MFAILLDFVDSVLQVCYPNSCCEVVLQLDIDGNPKPFKSEESGPISASLINKRVKYVVKRWLDLFRTVVMTCWLSISNVNKKGPNAKELRVGCWWYTLRRCIICLLTQTKTLSPDSYCRFIEKSKEMDSSNHGVKGSDSFFAQHELPAFGKARRLQLQKYDSKGFKLFVCRPFLHSMMYQSQIQLGSKPIHAIWCRSSRVIRS